MRLSSCILSKNIKLEYKKYAFACGMVRYGCETWSLTVEEEQRLRVYEKRVLRRIFGPKRDEVAGA
jgi:hypothetical protein